MQITAISKLVKMSNYKKLLVTLCLVIMLSIAATCGMLYIMLKSDKIVKGTYINDINVSSLTMKDAKQLVDDKYKSIEESLKINIKNGTDSISVNFLDAGIKPAIDKAVEEAYSIGRDGNIFHNIYANLKSAFKESSIKMQLTVSDKEYTAFIDDLDKKFSYKPVEASISIDGQKLVLNAGSIGKSVDREKLFDLFVDNANNISSFDINLPLKDVEPKQINTDEIYAQIKQDCQDARVDVVNNTLTYVDAVPGRDIDKNELSRIVDELNTKKSTSKVLPVSYIKPKVNIEDIKPKVFRDTMATYSTQFYRGDQNNDNRSYNIELAVNKLSGKIIGPGETFSFNQTVGARTEAEGYKVAHVYSGGQVVDDVGGGICQVSTTLYNAALYSDMSIVERTNHMFTVGYVELGQDAAVAYDYVDMKFKNTSGYPIKIVGEVTSDNRVVFSIIGTVENPGKKVEINNTTIKNLDFSTKYIDDPKMAKGNSYTKTYGMPGCIVETYKIVKENGNVVSEKKLYTSTYNPLTAEVVRGTGR